MFLPAATLFDQMDTLGLQSKPFVFAVDFEMQKGILSLPAAAQSQGILFDINGHTNAPPVQAFQGTVLLKAEPVDFATYQSAFDCVHHHLQQGNSYLTNLTFRTPIHIKLSLHDIFLHSRARYRLLYGDEFVVFSPETFVRTRQGVIFSYPMKGTLDATLPDAYNRLLSDEKEKAEHNTIVDLIRNDLGMVCSSVQVEKFRYVETIQTHKKPLLQVSSSIMGNLMPQFRSKPGSLLQALLPAGSVSGAPKEMTLRIISQAEAGPRGFYTGVCGYFDGTELETAVMIRFIGNHEGKLTFQSGGGITILSQSQLEYDEMIQKVYVPIF